MGWSRIGGRAGVRVEPQVRSAEPPRAASPPTPTLPLKGGGGLLWRPAAAHRLGEDLLAGLPMAWLAVFFLAPLGFTFVFAFGRSLFGAVELGFTLDNFRVALSGFYLVVFLRTIQFAITGCLLCLLVAYPVAYFIARHAGRFR